MKIIHFKLRVSNKKKKITIILFNYDEIFQYNE